jgi:hypothetical protein
MNSVKYIKLKRHLFTRGTSIAILDLPLGDYLLSTRVAEELGLQFSIKEELRNKEYPQYSILNIILKTYDESLLNMFADKLEAYALNLGYTNYSDVRDSVFNEFKIS